MPSKHVTAPKASAPKPIGKLSPEVAALAGEVVRLRRHFHQHPETAFKEHKTAEYVEAYLKKLGIPYKRMVGTGVVGLIDSGKPGPCVMLRADMDALPVTEETGAEYASVHPGVMHACGHDSHTAVLLTAARVLKENGLPRGKVKLCFQPGEEGSDGGGAMVKAGVLESPKVDFAFALHVWNPMEAGKVSADPGPRMAAVDEFLVDIIGVGGHAAHPQDCADPVAAAAAVITNLHSIVSRNIDPFRPAVLTVAAVNAGTAFNIIPPKASMKGTIRTFHKDVRAMMKKRFMECCTKTAAAMGCKAEIEFRHMLGATVNDEAHTPFVREIGAEVFGKKNLVVSDPSMGGEDFSRYAEKVPAVFAFIVAAPKDPKAVFPHHHPKFCINENVLPACVEMMRRVALAYLEKK